MTEEYKRGEVIEIIEEKGKKSLRIMIKNSEVGEFSLKPNGKGILKELKAGDNIIYKADRFYTLTEFYILGYKN
jgi:hypothetical protein